MLETKYSSTEIPRLFSCADMSRIEHNTKVWTTQFMFYMSSPFSSIFASTCCSQSMVGSSVAEHFFHHLFSLWWSIILW